MRIHEVGVALALVAGVATGAYAQEGVVRLPDQIEFKGPLKPGPEQVVLFGDPTKAGVYVVRVKLAKGVKIPPHWYPDQWRTAVILSGTLYFGLGEQWDDGKMTAYPAGTFFTEPAKTVHYVWAKDGDVILQVTAMGPTGTTLVQQK